MDTMDFMDNMANVIKENNLLSFERGSGGFGAKKWRE